jgi:hypothetical protein
MDVEAEGDSGPRYTGGFAGAIQKSVGGGGPETICCCYATGDVIGKWGTGGFVGANFDEYINKSYATGESHGYTSGGFAGYSVGTITDCYATGDVYDYDKGSGDNIPLIGSFIGHGGGMMTNCYATGTVIITYADFLNNVGGFVGNSIDGTTYSDCFWDTQTSGQSSSDGGTGKTTSEMKNVATFTSWNIASSSTDLNNGYPYLGWQLNSTDSTWYIHGGSVETNVWNEANTSESLVFDILVTNINGTETYQDTDCTYSITMDTVDIPHGEKTIFIINSDGFKPRVYYYDISLGTNYSFDFYLPPDETNPYYDQTLRTTTRTVSNPNNDLTLTMECTPRHIVSVQAWNQSLYGHWYTISQDNYTLNNDQLTISSDVFDVNTSVAQVNYYCLDTEEYALQYMLQVVGPQEEYGYDPPIENVLVEIKTYINRTETWETISRLYTDANGQTDVYLLPGTLYKVTISKDGYKTGLSDILPSPEIRTHTLRLIPDDFDFPSYESFWNDITITGSIGDTNLTITFYDKTGQIINTTIRVYEVYDGSETLLNTDGRTGETSFNYNVSVNTTRDHRIKLWFNTSATYNITLPISLIVYGEIESWRDAARFDLNARFEALFGEFTLGYANTICIVLALIALAIFGPFHAGVGILSSGLTVIVIQSILSIHTVNMNAGLSIIGVLIVFLGILYMVTIRAEETI